MQLSSGATLRPVISSEMYTFLINKEMASFHFKYEETQNIRTVTTKISNLKFTKLDQMVQNS